jgi:hypothetical protein
VWIHHAAVESSDDAAEMRAHQAFHMDSRGWNDIAYSLALPDPNPGNVVFEGRGIGIDGGHTATENTESHGILVMGNFQVDHPSPVTIDVLVKLLRAGRAEGWWQDPSPATNIGGHRDAPTANTSCPGNFLYYDIPAIRVRVAQAAPPPPVQEDDVAYYTIYSGPNMATRLVVDGSMTAPSGTELAEMVARYKAAGYVGKAVKFTEADDYARFVHGHPSQVILNET